MMKLYVYWAANPILDLHTFFFLLSTRNGSFACRGAMVKLCLQYPHGTVAEAKYSRNIKGEMKVCEFKGAHSEDNTKKCIYQHV